MPWELNRGKVQLCQDGHPPIKKDGDSSRHCFLPVEGTTCGDATKLDFDDETFDAVTSNYVYHNITGVNKQMLLRETLRVLKKGGTFAIHDIMSKSRYGNMQKFIDELKAEGYEEVRLIPTDNGMFMSKLEGTLMMLGGSSILVGRK